MNEQFHVPPVVYHQAINLAILVGILFYFLKDTVRSYFKNKRENYLKAAAEVTNLRKQVEEQTTILKNKIRELDTTAEQSQKSAEQSAKEYQTKLLTEARDQAEKLKKETEKTITAEVHRAFENLKAEIVDESISNSRALIQNQIKDNDQKRLLSEFVEKIGVVRQ